MEWGLFGISPAWWIWIVIFLAVVTLIGYAQSHTASAAESWLLTKEKEGSHEL